MEGDLKIAIDQIGYIDDIDKNMTSVWAKWYESGEKEKKKAKAEKAIKHADKEVREEEKRAMGILKQLQDRVATIGDKVDKHETALKDVMDKLW